MNHFREITLGTEAIDYIRQRLASGNTLATWLLQRADIDNGRVVTFLPPYVNEEAAKEFTTGGKISEPFFESHENVTNDQASAWKMVPTPNTDLLLVETIQAFLTTGEERICILEDPLAKANDPGLTTAGARVLVFKEEVYYLLSEPEVEGKRVLESIRRAATHWLFIGAMTSMPKGFAFTPDTQQLTARELRAIAEQTEKIIIGAYDGEGYLIWNRP